MRGKVFERPGGFVEIRITPAYAGKRSKSMTLRSLRGDHPRVCGEKRSRRHHLVAEQGSPPRMRGKVLFRSFIVQPFGITPAYAGKRVRCSQQALPRTDHPRMCGEKSSTTKPASSRKGSPPRMRGKAQIRLLSIWQRGITPAYAGKRKTAWKGEGKQRITPACAGKSQIHLTELQHHHGSPPHVRGKVELVGCVKLCLGITPACAGKSAAYASSTAASQDYPRMCGEKTKNIP